MFFGRYEHAVDAKGRLAVPVKLRDSLRYEGERSIFYVCRGPNGCLRMFTERDWDSVVKQMNSSPLLAGEQLDELRLLFSSAEKVAVDAQGRILLPAFHKKIASIAKDVMIIGMNTFIEIWDKKKWDAFESAKGDGFGSVPTPPQPEAAPARPKATP